jgi:adenosine kinase
MGSIKIAHHGTQNHHFTRDEFGARFKKEFGHDFA